MLRSEHEKSSITSGLGVSSGLKQTKVNFTHFTPTCKLVLRL